VAQAYAKAGEIFKHLIKQAALAERRFSEATIQRWVKEEKIYGQWQIAQARKQLFGSDRQRETVPEQVSEA